MGRLGQVQYRSMINHNICRKCTMGRLAFQDLQELVASMPISMTTFPRHIILPGTETRSIRHRSANDVV